MSEDRLVSIDKLHASNWMIWKMQLMNFLKARKLWKLCLGTETLSLSLHKLLLWGRMVFEDFEVGTDHQQRVLAFGRSAECGTLQQERDVRQVQQSTSRHAASHSRSRAEKKLSPEKVGKDTFLEQSIS